MSKITFISFVSLLFFSVGFVGNSNADDGCNPGSYWTGSICVPCPAGHSCSGGLSPVINPCGIGAYQPYSGQSTCYYCSIGTYNPYEAATSCISASPGYVVRYTGQTSQAPCYLGSYQDQWGQSECLICPTGTYQDQWGQTGCITTPPGYFNDFPQADTPIPCSVGQYQPAAGQDSCFSCPLGYYQNQQGQYACIICPPGTTTQTLGTQSIIMCSAATVTYLPFTDTYYSTLQYAYDAAQDGSDIQTLGILYNESIDCGQPKGVVFSGGYDPLYSASSGNTTISGTFVIRIGSVVLNNIVIQ